MKLAGTACRASLLAKSIGSWLSRLGLLANCFCREGFEAGLDPEDNNPI